MLATLLSTLSIILGFLGLGGAEIFLVALLFLILPLIIIAWALIDVLRSDFQNDTNKIIWVLVILFVPFLGSILYFLIGRKQKALKID